MRGRGRARGRGGRVRGSPVSARKGKNEIELESGSNSDSSYEAESSDADDSDADEHWVPNEKKMKRRGRPTMSDTAGPKRARVVLQKMKSEPKKGEQSKDVRTERKESVKTITIGNLTFPEPLPLKKPSEREWEAAGMDMYGHMVPDPDCKWGLNFVVPHNLEKHACDICQLECASRTGLVNHRKTHFKTLKRFEENSKPEEAKAKCSSSSTSTTATVKPTISHIMPTPQRKRFNAQGSQTEISGNICKAGEKSSGGKNEESTRETIYRLVDRGELKQCVCGLLFTDTTLYFLHKGIHHDEDPKKCSLCGERFPNYYDFSTHFYDHQHTAN